MRLLSRKLPLPQFFIDTNMINARGRLPFMNLIEKWHENDVIALRMPLDAQAEAEAGFSPSRTLKAWSYITPLPLITTPKEQAKVELIRRILCGSRPISKSDERDARIVFTAVKYHAILITGDGASNSQPRGILGGASELKQSVGAQIMSPADAVTLIRRYIATRDTFIRRFVKQRHLHLPDWIGAD
jgi:hypothetical protein